MQLQLASSLMLSCMFALLCISGFEILAFPCNQFLYQEPGTSQEAHEFACTRFQAEYPVFQKVGMSIKISSFFIFCFVLFPVVTSSSSFIHLLVMLSSYDLIVVCLDQV